MKLLLSLFSFLLCLSILAMPTEQELSKAGPLIQELMHDDLTAMRNGKKTREQVGDAAAKLARALQMDFSPELHPSYDRCSEHLECAS